VTFEARMAELGVDLSDLPKHKRIPMLVINRKISEWKSELIDNPLDLYRFILHLTDIIDRMETRLVNVTGERDYLLRLIENHWNDELFVNPCEFCRSYSENEKCWRTCDGEEPLEIGVPEDWRADDGSQN